MTPRRRGLWQRGATYVVLGAGGACTQMLFALPLYSPVDRFLACVLLVIALIVSWRFVAARRPEPPIMVLISLQFYVMYGLPQFTQESFLTLHGALTPSADSITLAMLLATLSSAGCWAAYQVARGSSVSGRVTTRLGAIYPEVRISWRGPVIVYAVLCLGSKLWQLGDTIPIELQNIVAKVFNPLLAVSLLLFIGYRLGDALSRRVGIISIVALCTLGLIGSMLESIIVPIYLYFMSRWLWTGRLQARWVAVGVFIFFLLNPVKAVYREAVLNAEPVRSVSAALYRFALWRTAVIDTYTDPFGKQRSVETATSRTSGLLEFAQVIEWTPEIVPYQYGKNFATSLVFWVPRAIWPGKPSITELVNDRYAVDFQIASPEAISRSTFGMRQPADGYWDFGALGAIAYPALFGIITGVICRPSKYLSFLTISLLFSAEFFQTLANLQYIAASLLTLLAGSWIAMKAIQLAADAHARVATSAAARTGGAGL
jgi:hypothetical protein